MRYLVPFAAALGLASFLMSAVPHADGSNLVTPSTDGQHSRIAVARPKGERKKPLAVVIADNRGTETTDFVVPLGVLRHSGVLDVTSASTETGVVGLMPALRVDADTTLEAFDREHPEGADIVIVPALHNAENHQILSWLRKQARKGSLIVSICEGARVLAAAGLLDGKKAATHWYAIDEMAADYPNTLWIKNRRFVADGNIVSTAGVTASIPVSLAIIEAVAGRKVATKTASDLGVGDWSPSHNTDAYSMPAWMKVRAASNLLSFWGHRTIGLETPEGTDDIALALTADAWARTYRSKAVALNEAGQTISSHGIRFSTERMGAAAVEDTFSVGDGATSLDHTLAAIERHFGRTTSRFVAVQLEYPMAE